MDDADWNEDEEETIPGMRLDPGRVLVADDDPGLRFIVVSRLLDDGHIVSEVDTGARVLSAVASSPEKAAIDLVVMDQRMAGLVGLDVVREMRARGARTPIILMTAFPEPSLLDEAMELGVPVLAKPFSLHRLSRFVARAIHAGIAGRP